MNDEVLKVGLDVDAKKAIQAMAKFERQMRARLANVTKTVENLGKKNKKAVKEAIEDSEEWLEEIEDLSEAHIEESKEIDKKARRLHILGEAYKTATGEAKASIKAQIAHLKKSQKSGGEKTKGKPKGKKEGEKVGSGFGTSVRDGLRDAFAAFFSKDVKGLVKLGGKGIGSVLGGVGKRAAEKSAAWGAAMKERGKGLTDRGNDRGGAQGAAMKAMGGAMSKMGGALEGLQKIGPVLKIIGSAVMGLIELFVDAESQAKEFNRDLLNSASTAEMFGKHGASAKAAYGSLTMTLEDLRNGANDLSNIKDGWWINPDTFKSVISALTQEGVSLNRIEQEATAAGQSVKDLSLDIVRTSVAYSRSFGVSIQEINELQASMMTDMGSSLQETRLSFAQMTRSAVDSGIAANKFYAIIRGVSSDLSLYNTRLEDATKTLQLLGKVMNPREAGKFMSTAVQGLKNMGRQERLRMTFLAGSGKMQALVNRDIASKAKVLGQKVQMTGEDVLKIMAKDGAKGLEEKISGLPDEAQGDVREMGIELGLQMKRAGKGVFGVSSASQSLNPAAALEAMKSAVTALSGGGDTKLQDIVGTIGGEMMAENLGISQEQLNQMAKFESSIDSQREVLKKQLKEVKKQLKEGDAETIKRLTEAGLDTAEKIDKAGYDQIYQGMDEGTKQKMEDDAKTHDFAQETSKATATAADKLDILVKFVMNQLYNVISGMFESASGILDAIYELFGKGDTAAKKRESNEAQRWAIRQNDPEVIKALEKNRDDAGNVDVKGFKQALYDMGKGAKFAKTQSNYNQVMENGDEGQKVGAKKAMTRAIDLEMTGTKESAIGEAINKVMGEGASAKFDIGAMQDSGSTAQALLDAGVSMENLVKIASELQKEMGDSYAAGSFPDYKDSVIDPKASESRPGVAALQRIADESSTGTRAPGEPEVAPPVDEKLLDATTKTADNSAKSAGAIDEVAEKGARRKNSLAVKFGDAWLTSKYQKSIRDGTLEALRLALFEFYMYSELSPGDVAKYLNESGTSIDTFAQQVSKAALAGDAAGSVIGTSSDEDETAPGDPKPPRIGAHAKGGLVTGVNGGLAMVRAAAGEGLASIGKGERILPAGAGMGNQTFPITVAGIGGQDLANVIHAAVVDTVVKYKRRERFSG